MASSMYPARVFYIWALVPIIVYATELEARYIGINDIALRTWLFVFFFSSLGWGAKNLEKVADWWDVGDRKVKDIIKARLGLMQTVVASNVAGCSTYFLGKWMPEAFDMKTGIPEMGLFFLITIAGYSGSGVLEAASKRFFKTSTNTNGSTVP